LRYILSPVNQRVRENLITDVIGVFGNAIMCLTSHVIGVFGNAIMCLTSHVIGVFGNAIMCLTSHVIGVFGDAIMCLTSHVIGVFGNTIMCLTSHRPIIFCLRFGPLILKISLNEIKEIYKLPMIKFNAYFCIQPIQ
jgi:hypothetical protein